MSACSGSGMFELCLREVVSAINSSLMTCEEDPIQARFGSVAAAFSFFFLKTAPRAQDLFYFASLGSVQLACWRHVG